MNRSIALALVVLSLPLVGCAEVGVLSSGASSGGGSGGSPGQGTPSTEMHADAPARAARDVAARESIPVRESAGSTRELASHDPFRLPRSLSCRQCR